MTRDLSAGTETLGPGQVLGGRYQVHSQLGRGGMGEVWRALDLKLRVEVALKALLPDRSEGERRRDLLRREVRAAREVVSPNVCRIFDLIEVDGSELVSMEFIDGCTLLDLLREQGPLDLKRAQDIAAQFLAGLEAIHQAGLVHRDVKPENIMITRTGRVVLMDFGLAQHEGGGAGTVAGTPAYMAPEQAAGREVDARADVYAAGVVLAEMVSPQGIKSVESRRSLWEGVRAEPARVPDSPWAPVIVRAVAKDPDQRYHTAHTLTRALEEVTLRRGVADDLTPYPGLAFFTEDDAEYFYGREAEVEAMWLTLERPHLLALIGPSGAGKSSFLRAGLIPARPQGWSLVVATPGSSPFVQLAQALASELAGDTEAIQELVRSDDSDAMVSAVGRWRACHDHAVLVLDQFEELFTLCAAEVHSRFADLLGRLALEADVHVLLSMRDDFLFHCQTFEALRPVFAEVTPLGPPVGGALRRALVQPASTCGFRFESDALVEEMLAEVEGERGSLPLLAFAANRLWEARDREQGLLTREAYQRIGGVGGALARHAEQTLEAIGEQGEAIVRELLRNLMTAEGTRAVRYFDELLSVFADHDRGAAEEVLRQLVDARLLTTFEVESEGEQARRRVEIVHESLLANWPRLVRWQTQDADSAQLRDQLRQAAQTWEDRDRSDDLLWIGAAYREYASWRERYPGGLTDTEQAFADGMTALAGRRRRRRRIAVTAGFAVLLAVLAVVGSFWQHSVREARRAEAARLVSSGQLELDTYPSAAVAHAIASLELGDSPAARRLALVALWKGPTALVVSLEITSASSFSADGSRLVQPLQTIGSTDPHIRVTDRDGSSTLFDPVLEYPDIVTSLNPAGDVLYSRDSVFSPEAFLEMSQDAPEHVALRSVPDGRLLAEHDYGPPVCLAKVSWNDRRVLVLVLDGAQGHVDAVSLDGSNERLGSPELGLDFDEWKRQTAMDLETGRWLGAIEDGAVSVIEIREHDLSGPRTLGRHQGSGMHAAFHPRGLILATANDQGLIRLWDPTGASPPKDLQGPPGIVGLRFNDTGSLLEATVVDDGNLKSWAWSLATEDPEYMRTCDLGKVGLGEWSWDPAGRQVAGGGPDLKVRLWSLQKPADAEPLFLLRGKALFQRSTSFHPHGDLLASADTSGLTVWPLKKEYPAVIQAHGDNVQRVAFGPQGRWLVSGGLDHFVRLWPLQGETFAAGRVVFHSGTNPSAAIRELAVSPDGAHLLVGTEHSTHVVPLDGGPSLTLPESRFILGSAFSADGRFAALADGGLRILEVETWQEVSVVENGQNYVNHDPHFLADGRVLASGGTGLWAFHPETGRSEVLYEGPVGQTAVSTDGRRIVLVELSEMAFKASGRAVFLDLDADTATPIETHGDLVWSIALDPTGTIVATGAKDGAVRVGPVTGEEPHLLLGHEGRVWSVDIDPLGRWIASGSEDTTVRLWPMPDLSRPPLHTLPREELIAKLKTLTNLRIVRDEQSDIGWTLTHDPFPGWETVPTW